MPRRKAPELTLQQHIADFLVRVEGYGVLEQTDISDIEHDCPGVSRDMVRHVLRQMRTEGLVQAEGLGRGAKWRAVPS